LPIPIQITYHKQRSSTARIRDGKIVMRISSYGTKKQQQEHIDSLLKKMTLQWSKQKHQTPIDILSIIKNDDILLSTGTHYTISFKQSDRKTIRINKVGNKLIIQTPIEELKAKSSQLKARLWDFLKKDQNSVLLQRINTIQQGWILETCNKLTLKLTKTRWGSCDKRKGIIMLSLKLLLVEPELLDYVIVHELAHLRHANHSKNFWKLVAQKCPNHKKLRKTLNSYN
jgi:predicted metal-dependent hydrolase